MSAYIVDRETIRTLVAAGLALVSDDIQVDPAHASRVGQELLDECVRSVAYRYPDNDDLLDLPGSYDVDTIPGTTQEISVGQWLLPYSFEPPEQPVDREQVADAVGCYEYQSCEHPDWEQSWAHAYCLGLRAQLAHLPEPPQPEREPEPDPEEFQRLYGDLSRDETIRRIRAALKRRSGKSWSVTGGRGTAWGWINIQSPPKRRTGKHVQKPGAAFGEYEHIDTGEPQEFGLMTPQDCRELAELLGKDRVHHQGESIPSGGDYYREYIDRAEGRNPTSYGTPYWD